MRNEEIVFSDNRKKIRVNIGLSNVDSNAIIHQ